MGKPIIRFANLAVWSVIAAAACSESAGDDAADADASLDSGNGGGDGTAEVITANNAGELALIEELQGHTAGIYALAWSPSGDRLATAGGDKTIRLWDATTWSSSAISGHTASVWSLSWSPDSQCIASVALDGTFRIWDVASELEIENVTLGAENAYAAAWSPDGETVAIGRTDGWILLFDTATGEITDELESNTEGGISTEIISLAWSPDGSRLASGGLNFAVAIWDTSAWTLVAELRADTAERNDINGLEWSHGGSGIAAAGQDGFIRLWNPTDYTEEQRFEHGNGWARGVAWTIGDEAVFATGRINDVGVYDAAAGASLASLQAHSSSVWAVDVSPDGSTVATGGGLYEQAGGDSALRIWGIP